ncbi:MAG: 4'-phosphopantetheinyl transferase superfamily protein [Acidimicrobiia bacterium]|nr:4'-phosphopantetheinyl transferase superfamily protein [Acidimicrobiia bacterium]
MEHSITIIHVDLIPDQGRELEALEWLDSDEHERCERFQSLVARRRYMLCRAALRAAICLQLGCSNEALAFKLNEHGKPFALVGGCVLFESFNVSHSGDHGLIALASRGCLGVDVEERAPRRNLGALIDGVCSAREQAELKSLDDRQRLHAFFRLWTIKEALVKAHGRGLAMQVAELEVPEVMRRGAAKGIGRFAQMPETSWHLEDIGTGEFAAAVAYQATSQS